MDHLISTQVGFNKHASLLRARRGGLSSDRAGTDTLSAINRQYLRLKHVDRACIEPLNIPGDGNASGLTTTIFMEFEGAGHVLPKYSSNLEMMTAAAWATGEHIARLKLQAAA